ncbi:MAG: glycerate kinase [Moraxella sp.]|nr:glycerate kinase [Moraxella sp.]
MNILIAPDAFKESLTAYQVATAIRHGFYNAFANAHFTLIPMADGGEGTTDALAHSLNGEWVTCTVSDPLGRAVSASYVLAGELAVIEMAAASGLHLVEKDKRNPLITSTYGTGELILDALQKGAKRLIIGIGGSATNDGGAGMLSALGFKFLDKDGQVLGQGGAELVNLAIIDTSQASPLLKGVEIQVACDVNNLLCGANGASHIYAPQKGADSEMVLRLDKALAHFASIAVSHGFKDCQYTAGAGAAGGLGFGLMSFLNASLSSGFTLVAGACGLENAIKQADLIITGEGKMDAQTSMGKVAQGVASLAIKHKKPVIAICGAIEPDTNWQAMGFLAVFASIPSLMPTDKLFANAFDNVKHTAMSVAGAMKVGQSLVSA